MLSCDGSTHFVSPYGGLPHSDGRDGVDDEPSGGSTNQCDAAPEIAVGRAEAIGAVLRESHHGWCGGAGRAGFVLGLARNILALWADAGHRNLPAFDVADDAQHD